MILGPTGVGKSRLAMTLAERLGGEIVNADSMQIYKKMDIGTAKPAADERKRILHHLVDIVYPDEPFDVAKYRNLADEALKGIHERNRTALVVGGTGFYIRILTDGIFSCPKDKGSIKKSLRDAYDRHGSEYLYRQLREKDPASAVRIHPHDIFRIIRALEVFEITGRPISDHQKEHRFRDGCYRVQKIGLNLNRSQLYAKIDTRCDAMIKQGLLEEVRGLLNQGYGEDLRPMKALGYRHMVACIKGIRDLDATMTLFKRDTRHYAKRQLTWFRRDMGISWFSPHEVQPVEQQIREFLSG